VTTYEIPDLDIDVKDRGKVVSYFPNAIIGSQLDKKRKIITPHNNGVYFQNIPVDPVSGLSAFPYDMAEELFGFYKIDLLPNHVYDLVEDEEDLVELLNRPVDWSWFLDERFYTNEDTKLILTHLGNYNWLCNKYPPTSIEDIAVLIALVRPRKKYLYQNKKSWTFIKSVIWEKLDTENTKQYFFKKSHAIAFAHLVVLHAQIIAWELKITK